jgi:hypothetical protein
MNLKAECFIIEDKKIVNKPLSDFDHLIEKTTRPTGVGYKYYVTSAVEATEATEVWALAMWFGIEHIVYTFRTEKEAIEAAEKTYVYDILNNEEVQIYMSLEKAQRALEENKND